jgi:hypothetical protein
MKGSIELLEPRRLFAAFVVNTTADSIDSSGPTVSLRDAIDAANIATTATTISFDPTVFATPQTITLSNGYLNFTSAQNVTITGPSVGVTIDGNLSTGVIQDSASGGQVILSNMTLTQGNDFYGGAINHTGNDTLKLENVTITGNYGYNSGGGIYNSGTLVIDKSTIENNFSEDGLELTGEGAGGGIDNDGGNVTITKSTISGNYATNVNASGGAGIANLAGVVNITASTIAGNSCYYNTSGGVVENAPGGGILNESIITLTNSTVEGNAGSEGGGIYSTGSVTLYDDTIASNTADVGGGLYDTGSAQTSVQNSVISGNTDFNGAASPNAYNNVIDPITSNGFNFVGETDGSSGWITSDITGTVANPKNAQLGTLQNNSGPTYTMLPMTGSPLIAAGSTTLVPNGVTSDQRGLARIYNGSVDIGSVEVQPIATLTVTPPADQTATENISSTINLGSFTETAATGPYTVDVNWGDGTTDTTFQLTAAGTITPTAHAFPVAGVDTVLVTVTAADGASSTGTFDVTVTTGSITIAPPSNQSGFTGESLSVALGSFTSINATAPYTVDVNWGDGSTDTTFSQNGTGTLPSESHAFTTVGADTVTVTITDATGNVSGSATFTVTLTGPSITVTAPGTQTAYIGNPTSFTLGSFAEVDTAGPYKVSVNWGDGSTATNFNTSSTGALSSQSHTFEATGTDTVTVTVTGASGIVSGSATFPVTIITGSTASSTILLASPTSIDYGQAVVLTATVGPSTATGNVTFLENGVAIATTNVSGGIASYTSTVLASGTDLVTAVYNGSETYAASTSVGVDVVVIPPPNTTALTLSTSTSTLPANQSVTLTATVSPVTAGGATATGSVTFYDGTTVLGTEAITASGVETLTTTTGLATGSNDLTAVYSGGNNFSASTSVISQVDVVPAVSTAVLGSSVESKTVSQGLTLTASFSSAAITPSTLSSVIPTGSVTFEENGTVLGTTTLGSNGIATLTTTQTLPQGIDFITATYTGSSLFTSTTSPVTDVYVTQNALMPVVDSASVPTAPVVGGSAVRGASIVTTLTNGLTNIETGPETGYFSVRVFASPSSTLDLATDPQVAAVVKKARIAEGKSIRVKVPITSLPASLATGTYHLLLETTDSRGNIEVIDTGSTVNVVAPVINLASAFVSVPANVLTRGAIVSLETDGNANDLSSFTAVIGLSTDAGGKDIVASAPGTITPATLLVHLGKTTKVHITGWDALFAQLSAGSYYLTVTLTDATGNSTTTVSSTAAVVKEPDTIG